ncbi:hypothetical protein GQ600_11682 [Phytophthora cactorum]|nr:hypothetical protein GQ600_11682 [Phytophthora cactorum]
MHWHNLSGSCLRLFIPNGIYVVGDNGYNNTNTFLTPFPRPGSATAGPAPQDHSRDRRLYDSSDLAGRTDNYTSSEWIHQHIVRILERDTVLRPQQNRVSRSSESLE